MSKYWFDRPIRLQMMGGIINTFYTGVKSITKTKPETFENVLPFWSLIDFTWTFHIDVPPSTLY